MAGNPQYRMELAERLVRLSLRIEAPRHVFQRGLDKKEVS
jgi:hypothetical protein